MEIKTQLDWLYPELLEEAKFFKNTDGLEIVCRHKDEGKIFSDEVEINGKTYSFTEEREYETETERKRYLKRYAKLALYKAMSDYLSQTLPWGALTGIRPVKFAYNEGENWRREMGEVLGVSENKLDLVGRIIEAQKPVYEKKDGNCDFFIGIPFCSSRCSYCSFFSSEIGKSPLVDDYVDALVKEIKAAKPLIKNLRSVYVGGGTPVSLPISRLSDILNAIGEVNCEYTVEAGRPDSINEDNLKLLKERGITRICVNPQTFNDKTLEIIGRKHTAKDIYDKYELAKKYGFSVNMDLIAGLPGENFEDFKFSMDEAMRLSPDDITVHTLSLKKGSRLKELVDRLPDGEIDKMIDYSTYRAVSAGYEPYYTYRQKYMAGNLENTGYARGGKVCVYNIDVMEEIADNLACGANGVSKKLFSAEDRIERYGAPKDILTYINKIDEIIREKNKLFG